MRIKMKCLFFVILLVFLLNGCYTNKGRLSEDSAYLEYEVEFDKDDGIFYVPLTSDLEESQIKGE